jgi:hypothetical protein
MKKACIYSGSFLLLTLLFIVIFWKVRKAYYEPKVRDAKRFCETLIQQVEAAKLRNGKYPQAIDPSWFEGKQIPELIRLNDFYESRKYVPFLFPILWGLWDNIWGYQCGPGQVCARSNYDANLTNYPQPLLIFSTLVPD